MIAWFYSKILVLWGTTGIFFPTVMLSFRSFKIKKRKKRKDDRKFCQTNKQGSMLGIPEKSSVMLIHKFFVEFLFIYCERKALCFRKIQSLFLCLWWRIITFFNLKTSSQIDFKINSLDSLSLSISLNGLNSACLEDRNYVILKLREFSDTYFLSYKVTKNELEISE